MADFNSIVADVMVITNRPDLISETQLAVKSATLQLHRSDFYYKDIVEATLQFNVTDYLQSIDYRAIFPTFRNLKYLRKYDPFAAGTDVAKGVGDFFDVETPESSLTSYGLAREDVVYAAGSLYQVRSSTPITYAITGVYVNPVVASPDTYASWIALEAPNAIVALAAAKMFGGILGNANKSTFWNSESLREFTEVSNSNIVAKGE